MTENITENEKFVRAHWKIITTKIKDNDSYGPDLFILEINDGINFHKSTSEDEGWEVLWDKAAEYTRQLLTERSKLCDEIAWLENKQASLLPFAELEKNCIQSIIRREQKTLADMSKGMIL